MSPAYADPLRCRRDRCTGWMRLARPTPSSPFVPTCTKCGATA